MKIYLKSRTTKMFWHFKLFWVCKRLRTTATALCRWGIIIRPPTTAAQFINKSSMFNLLLGDVRPLDMKLKFAKKLIGLPSVPLAQNRLLADGFLPQWLIVIRLYKSRKP